MLTNLRNANKITKEEAVLFQMANETPSKRKLQNSVGYICTICHRKKRGHSTATCFPCLEAEEESCLAPLKHNKKGKLHPEVNVLDPVPGVSPNQYFQNSSPLANITNLSMVKSPIAEIQKQ